MDHPERPGSGVKQEPSTIDAWTPRYRQMRTGYLLTALVLIAAYPVSPTWAQHTIKLGISLATIPALLLGTRRISRNRRAPWILLLAALTLINLANVVRLLPGDTATTVDQLLDAVGNLVLLFAALQLIRQQGRANLGSIIDTSIIALAVGGLLWDLVLAPNLIPSSQTHPAKLALFIVVFALSGVLGALAQLIIQRPVPALRPLVPALALALVADIVMAVTTNPQFTTIASMMIIGAYTAVGLFGLDPTAEQLVTPAPARPDGSPQPTRIPRSRRRRPTGHHRRPAARRRISPQRSPHCLQRHHHNPGHAAHRPTVRAARPRRSSPTPRGDPRSVDRPSQPQESSPTRSARSSPATTTARSSSATSNGSKPSTTVSATPTATRSSSR